MKTSSFDLYVGSSITQHCLAKPANYVESITKNNVNGRNFIMTCGFEAPEPWKRLPNLTCIPVDLDKVQTKSRNGWPQNRPFYATLQCGEFIQHCTGDPNDVLIFTDYDVTMQRPFKSHELAALEQLPHGVALMELDSTPPLDMQDYLVRAMKPRVSLEEFGHYFDMPAVASHVIYNAGVIAARRSTWSELWERCQPLIEPMSLVMTHHGATQFLICYAFHKWMKIERLPFGFHNAHWFDGTKARREGNQLVCDDEVVLFNHHKHQFVSSF